MRKWRVCLRESDMYRPCIVCAAVKLRGRTLLLLLLGMNCLCTCT